MIPRSKIFERPVIARIPKIDKTHSIKINIAISRIGVGKIPIAHSTKRKIIRSISDTSTPRITNNTGSGIAMGINPSNHKTTSTIRISANIYFESTKKM